MERPGFLRILQWVVAIGLFTCAGLSWRYNAAGQNIINLTSCFMFVVGLDNLLVYYRCFKEKSSLETEGTFVIFCLFILGIMF
jgi:hypothetical protein